MVKMPVSFVCDQGDTISSIQARPWSRSMALMMLHFSYCWSMATSYLEVFFYGFPMIDLGYPKIHGIFCDFPWNRPSIDWGSPINWNPPGDPQGMWLGWVDTTPKARFLSGSIGYVLWKAGFSLMMFAPSGYQGCSKAELNVIEVCGIYVSLFCNVFPIFWNCLWIFS